MNALVNILISLMVVVLSAPGQFIFWLLLPKRISEKFLDLPSSIGIYHFIAMIIGVLFIVCTWYLLTLPVAESAKAIAIITALGALLAWTTKRGFKAMEDRALLILIESLSHGIPKTRESLKEEVRSHSMIYRYFPTTYSEVLSSLVATGRVVIESGLYRLANGTLEIRRVISIENQIFK